MKKSGEITFLLFSLMLLINTYICQAYKFTWRKRSKLSCGRRRQQRKNFFSSSFLFSLEWFWSKRCFCHPFPPYTCMLSDDIIIIAVIIVIIFLYIGITIKVFKLSLRVSFVSHQKSAFIQAEKNIFSLTCPTPPPPTPIILHSQILLCDGDE